MGSLNARTAVVTGVSRRQGIGFAVASLAGLGASLLVQHWSPHDADQPWGADDIGAVVDALRSRLAPGARLADVGLDLASPDAGERLVAVAEEQLGHLDILVCNHARSGGDGRLRDQTSAMLDAHWQVNTRSTLLATRAFAAQHDGRPGGRVVWMTSGQQASPMPEEIAYATSKAALAGITASVAHDLIERGIVLNTVNPGPVNTGYLNAGWSATRGTGSSDRCSPPTAGSAADPHVHFHVASPPGSLGSCHPEMHPQRLPRTGMRADGRSR